MVKYCQICREPSPVSQDQREVFARRLFKGAEGVRPKHKDLMPDVLDDGSESQEPGGAVPHRVYHQDDDESHTAKPLSQPYAPTQK